MELELETNSFAFFKILSSTILLIISALFSNSLYPIFTITTLMLGRAHSFGAYMAIWRAKRMTWPYAFAVVFYIIVFIYLGFSVWSLDVLLMVTYILFAFHFIFDEFILQEQSRDKANILSALFIFGLLITYILSIFLTYNITFYTYLIVSAFVLALELIYIKKINWFFVDLKILNIFTLYCIYASISPTFLFATILLSHYLFWFIYPVYKLHKFKRAERDSFIMILIVAISVSIFYMTGDVVRSKELYEYSIKYFAIVTIVHILTTAPFGYIVGLKKPERTPQIKEV